MFGVDDRVTRRKRTRKHTRHLEALANRIGDQATLDKILNQDERCQADPAYRAAVRARIVALAPRLGK